MTAYLTMVTKSPLPNPAYRLAVAIAGFEGLVLLVAAVGYLFAGSWVVILTYLLAHEAAILGVITEAVVARIAYIPCRLQFAVHTRRFRTAAAGRVVLHYASEVDGKVDTAEILQQTEDILCEFEILFASKGYFQKRPRVPPSLPCRRVHVYLFATVPAVQAYFGPYYAGAALWWSDAVVIPFYFYCRDETLRHELAHLFLCRRWNQLIPPLLSEGLPTFLQETWGGVPMDRHAAPWIAARTGDLKPLLVRQRFFHGPDRARNYALAGSFTGFLIRRFGWQTYLRFYNQVRSEWRFEAKFRSSFGQTLAAAEAEWQQQVMQKRTCSVAAYRR